MLSTKLTPKKAQNLIRKWLLEGGYKIQLINDPHAHFNILAEDKDGKKVNIAQSKGKDDVIGINTAALLLDSQKEELNNMDENERSKILWQIRLSLINKNVGFSPIGLPLDFIKVSQVIYYDGLTKDNFMQRLLLVYRALLLVMWMVERSLGVEVPSDIDQEIEESLFYIR